MAQQASNFRPLAGRPPFATDDDTVYDLPAQPRPARQPKPENPNARTSAYNTYAAPFLMLDQPEIFQLTSLDIYFS